LIYFSSDPDFAWQGSMLDGEYFVPVGVYSVQIAYSRPNGESEILHGSVSLIR